MIELWSWPAPQGRPVHILLEETGLPYSLMPVDTRAAAQIDQDFLGITANYRIPAIVDPQAGHGRLQLAEPGAILIYLAEKAGNFIPTEAEARFSCLQWLMFSLGGLAPALQHDAPMGAEAGRNLAELRRLLNVLEQRLQAEDYLAGIYSIADMAAYPWIAAVQAIDLESFPATRRWADRLANRPAVGRGMTLMRELQ
jgi:GST-like protein